MIAEKKVLQLQDCKKFQTESGVKNSISDGTDLVFYVAETFDGFMDNIMVAPSRLLKIIKVDFYYKESEGNEHGL